MNSISVKAYAKINPLLDVLGVRPDGYHDICTVMQTLQLHDTLLIKKSRPPLRLVCNRDDLPVDERNLVYQAADYLIRAFNIRDGISIDLHKIIPVSAGLAGGSSDCAAALMGLNTLFGLNISKERLMEIGRRFGADVPFCLMGGTALAEGTGEVLTPLSPHPPVHIVLARPPVSVSTGEVFRRFNLGTAGEPLPIRGMLDAIDKGDLPGIAAHLANRLQPVTVGMHPEISSLVEQMRRCGALNASMSGSGPTVFGYFDSKDAALSCIDHIRAENPFIREIFLTGVLNNREDEPNETR